MYLKSLELHGFKSFPDKTVLRFNEGSTVIVGPNGSGKSNITDAMRWVLGELSSKSLRGSKMEDVIFSGADGVRPMGFAEVSITFDNSGEDKKINSEYDEITVTRRYYRAGDSAYFINKKPVRLKDIIELFMNTGVGREGYSIIGQGRIAEIISKKSEDRRSVFEEAAGITKYRYRKNESQKRLAETEDNMTRVGDIASELESRIGPLERDSTKAKRYLELYEIKKKLDISLWRYDMDKLRESTEQLERECTMSAHELEMAEDTINQLGQRVERMYENSRRNAQETQRYRDALSEVRVAKSKIENDAKLNENNILYSKRSLDTAKKRKGEAEKSLDGAKVQLSSFEERLAEVERLLENQRRICGELSSKRAEVIAKRNTEDTEVERLFKERQTADANLSSLRVRLSVLKNSVTEGEVRSESIKDEIHSYAADIEKLEEQIKSISEVVSDYDSRINGEKDKFNAADRGLNEAVEKRENLRGLLSRENAATEAITSRVSAMERMLEHFEGYNSSIKFVMNESTCGRLSGIHGPLSHLIRVESCYAVALETSMGMALQNIVTADEASAKAAIASLKKNSAGRATFYPITTVKGYENTPELLKAKNCRGFIGFADELVECNAEYRNIISSVVGRVCVFDNIDNASDMARASGWRVRAVTLDGQQINAGGSFTGGSARRDSGMLTRNAQIDELKKERASRELEAEKLSAEISSLDESIVKLTRSRNDADEKRRIMESLASVEKASLGELEAKRDMTVGLRDRLSDDMSKFAESTKQSSAEITSIEDEILKVENRVAELILLRETAASNRGKLDLEADELNLSFSDAQVRLAQLMKDAELLGDSISEAKRRTEELDAEIASLINEIERLDDEIVKADAIILSLSGQGDETEAQIKTLEEKIISLMAEGDKIEINLNELRRREKEHSSKKNILFVAHTKNTGKLENLKTEADKMTGRLWDEYELTYSAAIELENTDGYEKVSDGNRISARQRLSELKNQIKALGHINISAIDEYTEVKERYDSIRRQLDDLGEARRELCDIINGIEDDMRRMFTEAFGIINKNFGEVFRELFGGGVAELTLTNPEDVLTSGIEISAAPPGKTIKSLSLLSGGEQAFIAIALMFALIKYSPSPFCIFDEIEAALDEVNVARVANYIKKFSSDMQIIMITHRRGTMEIADTLYGVTMARKGISKVFTLDVNAVDDKYLKN